MTENEARPLDFTLDALKEIANSDCYGYDESIRDGDEGCTCPPCVAKRGLREAREWRYVTHSKGDIRRDYNPRERKMVDAWKKQVSDERTLGQILWEEHRAPSVRDWYVATCIVQWLATNVGTGVLEAAGFKYQEYAADDAERDARDEAKEGLTILRLRRVPVPAGVNKATDVEKPRVKQQTDALLRREPIFGVINRRNQVVTTGTKAQLEQFANDLIAALKEM